MARSSVETSLQKVYKNFSFQTLIFRADNSSSLYFRAPLTQVGFEMKRLGLNYLSAGLFVLFAAANPSFAQTNELPKFDEIYQLLRTNRGSLTEAELDRAAVNGLLDELRSRVVLITNQTGNVASNTNALSKSLVYENAFGYFRVGEIENGLNDKFKSSFQKINSTNKLKGLVLDLRFARGTDYAAAAKTADLFFKTDQPLLRWGDDSASATAKTNAIAIPVAVLVNHDTSGAAEALAGMLREANVALVIGTNTAGQASVFKEFTLSTGQRIKIASAPVKLGNGNEIPSEGLKPDIQIAFNAADEKSYYENPFYELPKPISANASDTNSVANNSETNRPRRRLNEAELVRMQREGISVEEFLDASAKSSEPDKPVITDPALVRALDLLKGLSVLQRANESRR